jgi:hypothetical protein
MIKDILEIRKSMIKGGLDSALNQLLSIAKVMNNGNVVQELNSVSSTYLLMKQYMLKSVEDTQRKQLYENLRVRVFKASSELLYNSHIDNNQTLRAAKNKIEGSPIVFSEVENKFAWFSQELAISNLNAEDSPKTRNLHKELFEYRQQIFNTLITKTPISNTEGDAIFNILSSPNVDVADARLIISALMLAQQFVFDINKFEILIKLCVHSKNIELRQYALIAIVFGRPDSISMEIYADKINAAFKVLATVPNIQGELAELQMQIILCIDTAKTEKTINDEIMPAIKSGAMSMHMKKTEQEMLDELLNPNKEDSNMEKVEKSMERIKDMQKKGADIFFGGFSQAKRFTFFYTLMNWFIPFYIEHPQISSVNTGGIPKHIIKKILDAQPFCSSDKYSFYLTLSMVYSQIPKEVVDLISRGEAVSLFDEETLQDKSYLRLMFLQDLYRFYKLSPNKQDFTDPFASGESAVFINWDKISELFKDTNYPFKIGRQLLRRNYFEELNILLENNNKEFDPYFLRLKAINEYKQKNYESALFWFEKLKVLEPENKLLIKRMADIAFLAENFDLSEKLYEDYISRCSNLDNYEFECYQLGLCYIKNNKIDEAKSILFKLYFNHENNINYKSAVALIYAKEANYPQALSIYDSIQDIDYLDQDLLRKSLILWQLREKYKALAEIRKLIETSHILHQDLFAKMKSEQVLCNIPIDDTELKILVDISYDKTIN